MSLTTRRKDTTLNDAIEYLDDVFVRCQKSVPATMASLDDAELAFIYDETEKCLDLRYYLENYHCIRAENGTFNAFFPWFEYQEILYEAIQEEWAENGYCKIIVLKPRQSGISTWVSASMFHRTIFMPHSYTMIVGQNEETATHLYDMSINAYHALPWWLRPEFLYKVKGDEIQFQRSDDAERSVNPGLGSILKCSNAQKMSGVAIGRSLRSLHACLTEKNLVYVPDGNVASIADVKVGGQVLTGKGYATVTAFSARPASSVYDGAETGFRVSPWNNSAFPIEGTGNHKILCVEMTARRFADKRRWKRGDRTTKVISGPKMVELKDVTKKHSLVIPVRPITSDGTMPGEIRRGKRAQGGGKQSSWTPPADSKDLGFAVGLYLAEGCVNKRVTLVLNRDEQHLADRFAKAIGVSYGKVVYRPDSQATAYHFYGTALGKWFSQNIGEKDDKRIPDWMWELGEDALAACVEGMILGDGHISPRETTTSFTTTRAQLAISIRDAVLALGMGYGGITSREAGFHYGRNCQKIYTVRWCHEVDEALRKRFGWDVLPSTSKKDYAHWQYSEDKKLVYANVRLIERVQIGTVYDIEVDTPGHTFLLPGAVTHNSEVSRWPDDGLFEADIKPSLRARDTYEVMESTGYGRQGFFYEHWRGSVEGDTGYRALFIPVYRSRKYYLPFSRKSPEKNATLRNAFTLREEEIKFSERVKKEEKFDIPKEFWNFHRKGMIAAKTASSKTGFIESYPLTPAQAFQASGICAFDRESLEEQEMKYVCKALWAGEISLGSDNRTPNTDMIHEVADDEILAKRKGERPSNRLHIWEMPQPGATYYIGSDSALGVVGGDYSVAEVFRAGEGTSSDVQVAEWWGHCPPQEFAKINIALGNWYGGAEIATEYQQAGITTGDKLVELDYPTLYRERMKDRPGGAYKPYFHFVTNVKTRESIIATMNEALLTRNRMDEPSVILRSEELLDEMTDFGSTGGRMEGQGNHDDSVMAAQICLYCMRETTTHLRGSANDDHRSGQESGDINVYGVFDNLGRQRGQYQDPERAKEMVVERPGWYVQPILICKANTLYSPIHDGHGAEHKLRFQYGMSGEEITPDLVHSFNAAHRAVSMGVLSDPDW
jgi:hypothetical protein